MFYANFILKKRGPLSRIWLAAHWDKKLTKAHIFETDIEGSVTAMLSPELKLALRTSSHLLLGVVRVYSRKTKYLLADCNEALVKIKLAFRPGVVDLPAENREASLAAINIREDFTSFDLDVTDFNEVDFHARFSVNQSRPEDITLREEVACVEFIGDDDFVDSDKLGGPITAGAVELFLDKLGSANYGRLADYFKCIERPLRMTDRVVSFLATPQNMARNASLSDSGFGSPSVWLESVGPAFGEVSGSPTKGFGDFGFNPDTNTIPEMNFDDLTFERNMIETEIQSSESLHEHQNGRGKDEAGKINENGQFGSLSVGDDCDEHYYENGGGGDDYDDDDLSLPTSNGRDVNNHRLFSEENGLNQKEKPLYKDFPEGGSSSRAKLSSDAENSKENNAFIDKSLESLNSHSKSQAIISDLTSAMENEADVFALGPVEVNVKERRTKRKRRLIVDEHKVISSEIMKSQLSDSSELVTPLDLAPPTKKLMLWKESGGVNRLFVLPGTMLVSAELFKLFSKNLFTISTTDSDNDDDDVDDTLADIAVEEEASNAKTRSPELKRDDVADSKLDMQSRGDVENTFTTATDLSVSLDWSSFSPSGNTSTPKRKSRRLNGEPAENFPELPGQNLVDENERGLRTDGSPKRKRRKQQLQQPPGLGTKSLELRPRRSNDSGLVPSDPEDDDIEDAIFDVEPAPTYGERAHLRQELEEAEMEERLLNRRSIQMQHILRRRLESANVLSFDQLTTQNNRKQAASKFYTILVLTKAQSTNVEQNQPYGDIQITRGPAFEHRV